MNELTYTREESVMEPEPRATEGLNVAVCEGWDPAVSALPDGYSLIVRLHNGAGYVQYEPPMRPGNRGPRQPRYTERFGWKTGPTTVGEALMLLSQQPVLSEGTRG